MSKTIIDGSLASQTGSGPIVQVIGLSKTFAIRTSLFKKPSLIQAVSDVSFAVERGQTYGLVGESGSGKSTVGRLIAQAIKPTTGKILLNEREIQVQPKVLTRRMIQMVFQDPYSSLDPRMRVGAAVEEPLVIHRIGTRTERRERVSALLQKVGMPASYYHRYPHEFSGGQRQRIVVARALALNPGFLVCDEAVSALDVSIQGQIINLFRDLQDELGISYLFISHDLSVVRHIADRIGVMYLGRLIEEGSAGEVLERRAHPYTQALVSSMPGGGRQNFRTRSVLKGDIPSPFSPPDGCVFHTRCPKVMSVCKTITPQRSVLNADHWVSCHLYDPQHRKV